MCSRRTRSRFPLLDTSSTSPLTAATSPGAPSVATSPSAAASVSANIPNRKRLRNTRRSTGPVAQEDVQLALETDQEGQMTADEDNGPIGPKGTTNTSGGGDQKQQAPVPTTKVNAGPTVIPVGGGASPIVDRKNTFTSGSVAEQQTVSTF